MKITLNFVDGISALWNFLVEPIWKGQWKNMMDMRFMDESLSSQKDVMRPARAHAPDHDHDQEGDLNLAPDPVGADHELNQGLAQGPESAGDPAKDVAAQDRDPSQDHQSKCILY